MNSFNSVPLSLRKMAGDVIEFPQEQWVGKDYSAKKDLSMVAENLHERLQVFLDFVYQSDTIEPGQLNKLLDAVEDTLATFAANLIELEEAFQEIEEEALFNPPESAKVHKIPGE